jgi:hypothetical protein
LFGTLWRREKGEPHVLWGPVVNVAPMESGEPMQKLLCGFRCVMLAAINPPLITASTSSSDTPRRLSIS